MINNLHNKSQSLTPHLFLERMILNWPKITRLILEFMLFKKIKTIVKTGSQNRTQNYDKIVWVKILRTRWVLSSRQNILQDLSQSCTWCRPRWAKDQNWMLLIVHLIFKLRLAWICNLNSVNFIRLNQVGLITIWNKKQQ